MPVSLEHRVRVLRHLEKQERKMAYNIKCRDLAQSFLDDQPHLNTTKRVDALARWIQDAIEAWVQEEDSNYEPPDPPGFEAGFAEDH